MHATHKRWQLCATSVTPRTGAAAACHNCQNNPKQLMYTIPPGPAGKAACTCRPATNVAALHSLANYCQGALRPAPLLACLDACLLSCLLDTPLECLQLHVEAATEHPSQLLLDTRGLALHSVTLQPSGQDLNFKLAEPHAVRGLLLRQLPCSLCMVSASHTALYWDRLTPAAQCCSCRVLRLRPQ
jgi:hypothetical protein